MNHLSRYATQGLYNTDTSSDINKSQSQSLLSSEIFDLT